MRWPWRRKAKPMPMHQPIPDPDPEPESQPPAPDGTYTQMPRDGRRYPFKRCRWCDRVLDRKHGITCPHCDRPQDPTTKE